MSQVKKSSVLSDAIGSALGQEQRPVDEGLFFGRGGTVEVKNVADEEYIPSRKDIKNWLKLAKKGNAQAQSNLGIAYGNGKGVEQDYQQAVYWYRKAAEQGFAQAQSNLGAIYYEGQGVEQDYQQAVDWFRKAAEQGDAKAQVNLGVVYDNGKGVEQDDQQAVDWFRKAAEQGNAEAQFNLGNAYYKGEGVAQDYQQAVYWYRKAAEQGIAQAQFNLGVAYYKGEGVEQDYQQAVDWFRKAAEQGVAQAQFNLGVAYANGKGVEQDYQQAVYWYRKAAAEQGDAQAQFNLGVAYANGKGVEQDYQQAVYWCRKAAEQGDAQAQFNLGVAYYKGKGVEQDYQQAVDWFRKAAEQGIAQAQFILGVAYANGKGVEQDYKQAVSWLRKAVEQGDMNAQLLLAYCYEKGINTENKDEIESLLCKVAANLITTKNDLYLEKEDELDVKIIKFLEEQKKPYTYIILAICHQKGIFFEQSQQKYQELLIKAEQENDLVATYLVGNDAFEKNDFHQAQQNFKKLVNLLKEKDKVFEHFQLLKNNEIEEEPVKSPYSYNIKQWLALLAQEKLNLIAQKQAKQELEDTMAMFAHKFKGPLQTIRYNAKHRNNPQTYLDAVETMSGLLEIFSIVSREDELLKTQFMQDIEPELSLEDILTKSLNLALTQLLTSGRIEYIIQHYAQYLKTTQQIPTTTRLKEFRKIYRKQKLALQQEWQQAFMSLAENNAELAQVQTWLTTHIAPLTIEGLEKTNIHFSQYGIKSSVFLIIFTELFLNAIKYLSSEPNRFIAFKIEKDKNFFYFSMRNTPDADDTTVGSQKGHKFLKTIARKLQGQFQAGLLDDGHYQAKMQLPINLFKEINQ